MIIQNFFTDPIGLMIFLGCIVVAVTVHEAAHAWLADRLGDPTGRLLGRVTLNPIKHLDPLGSILFLISGFGWGKPVPVDGFNLREPVKDHALVALAGPASNILMAFVVGLLFRADLVGSGLAELVFLFGWLNVNLAVFNLLPIPPLDGSRIYRAVFPTSFLPVWEFLDQYGIYILFALFLTGSNFLSVLMTPLISGLMQAFGYPGFSF